MEAYLGWTGMVSASSLAHFQAGKGAEKGMETVEMEVMYQSMGGKRMAEISQVMDIVRDVMTEKRLCMFCN